MYYMLMRWGWYQYRRRAGHPISIWRALFGQHPRFGSYDPDELHLLVDRPAP